MTRQALRYVEIDLPVCSRTYGVAPCTASVPTTGDDKCFNCRATCQDIANYNETTATIRFAEDTGFNPVDIEALPCIESVSYTPGRISLGQDLGQRSSVSITFRDFPHSDAGTGLDPYYADRAYDPYTQGTFWPRFRARQPYLKGATLRLIDGYVGDDLADMETRTFLVESFDGPGMDGRFTVTAKDPLKLLDADRAQAPALNTGYLSGSLTTSTTSATLLPVGIGDSEYPASGYAAIGGKEIVYFTRLGDTLTITRAQYNTTAIAHSANDRVQVCLVYTAYDVADIIKDLMVTYGGVDTAMIPIADWQAETDAFLGQVYTGVVAEPTSVRTLVSELILQAGLAVWYDDLSAQIRLQVLRAISTDAETFGDASDKLGGTLQITEQPDQRVSQVWTFFAQRNPLDGQEDGNNYRSAEWDVDAAAELAYGSSAIQKIYSRWIPIGGRTIAEKLIALQLGRFVVAPRKFTWDVFRSDGRAAPQLGSGARIEAWPLQVANGAADTVPVQITRVAPEKDRWRVEAEEMRFSDFGSSTTDKTVIYDSDVTARNLRDDHDALYGAPADGDTVTFIVNAGVKIGSSANGTPSITAGSWPTATITGNRTSGSKIITGLASTTALRSGQSVTGTGIPAGTKIDTVDSGTQVTLTANATSGTSTPTSLTFQTVILNVTLNGTVDGAGGKGGQGRSENSGYISPTVGQDGGTAFYTRVYINLTYGAAAKLRGGGGGGGGSATGDGNDLVGGGGGGGAGTIPGPGGPSGTGTQTAEAGAAGTAETGGIGGRSWTKNVPFALAGLDSNYRGGTGGAIGHAGSKGANQFSHTGANGGAVGKAIDGASYVTQSGTPASLLGGQVN